MPLFIHQTSTWNQLLLVQVTWVFMGDVKHTHSQLFSETKWTKVCEPDCYVPSLRSASMWAQALMSFYHIIVLLCTWSWKGFSSTCTHTVYSAYNHRLTEQQEHFEYNRSTSGTPWPPSVFDRMLTSSWQCWIVVTWRQTMKSKH